MSADVSTQHLVVLVNQQKLPLRKVEELTGISRAAIHKRLKRAGVHIPRKAPGGAPGKRTTGACAFCGAPVERYVRRVLRQKQMRMFCGQECYAASLEQHPYEEWRQGSRLARVLVAQHFPLQPEHIVHHKDGNQRHNDMVNLIVFANQRDHMAHHRGRKVAHLFDGATV